MNVFAVVAVSFIAGATVDCCSMAALKYMASIIGAGPLMVMDTLVLGLHKSKPPYSTFMSSKVAMLTPELPTLP